MPPTTFASNTLSAEVGTEHTLASIDEAGVYVLYVNKVNMVAGDVVELRAYKKVLSGDDPEVLSVVQYSGSPLAGVDVISMSTAIPNDLEVEDALIFTLKQSFGSAGRDFPWAVVKA